MINAQINICTPIAKDTRIPYPFNGYRVGNEAMSGGLGDKSREQPNT